MLGRGVHKDYDNATNGNIAALVTHMVRKTRMPDELTVFVAASEATAEIARRLSDSDADRFGPLFEARWRVAFKPVTVIPPGVDRNVVVIVIVVR